MIVQQKEESGYQGHRISPSVEAAFDELDARLHRLAISQEAIDR